MKLFKTTILALFATLMIAGCAKKQDYNLKGTMDESLNGSSVLLISQLNGDTIANTTIENGEFLISGIAEQPELAQLRIGGKALGYIILEPGDISVSSETVAGTPLNDILADWISREAELYAFLQANENDSTMIAEKELRYNTLSEYGDSLMYANIDNPVGAYFVVNNAYEFPAKELEKTMEEHPSLKNYAKLNKILEQKKLAAETGVGKHYKDFEVTYDGKTTKLSDLIKPDRYTLVDFWASWCGPCRREIPVIKELQEQLGPKGLDIVGVAVWDQPEDTEKAIEELGIDWPVIINAQSIPTDIYGILGIPTIILIGPDGIILSRDLQDQELKEAVYKALNKE